MRFPPPSTATQNEAEAHETPGCRSAPDSRLCGALHELPLNINTFSLASIATQNDAEGHDTEVREPPPFAVSIGVAIQELPL